MIKCNFFSLNLKQFIHKNISDKTNNIIQNKRIYTQFKSIFLSPHRRHSISLDALKQRKTDAMKYCIKNLILVKKWYVTTSIIF